MRHRPFPKCPLIFWNTARIFGVALFIWLCRSSSISLTSSLVCRDTSMRRSQAVQFLWKRSYNWWAQCLGFWTWRSIFFYWAKLAWSQVWLQLNSLGQQLLTCCNSSVSFLVSRYLLIKNWSTTDQWAYSMCLMFFLSLRFFGWPA